MKKSGSLVLIAAGLLAVALLAGRRADAQDRDGTVIRVAEIQIDPDKVEQYKAALREGIEAAVRLEPGVRAFYAVSVKDHPDEIRIFEVYANQAAYLAHLQTPHFLKYKATTREMVRSLKLIETDPILLRSK